MDDWNDMGDFRDYSAFFPDENCDLFGDSQLKFDLCHIPFPEIEIDNVFSFPGSVWDASTQDAGFKDSWPRDPGLTTPQPLSPTGPEALVHTQNSFTSGGVQSTQPLPAVPDDLDISDLNEAARSATRSTPPWKDSLIVFSARSGVNVSQKQRKTFTPKRRKEVAMNRKIGACVQCKLKKAPVWLRPLNQFSETVDG
jgi:hypothetical protein